MPAMKILLDKNNFPEAQKFNQGQRMNVTMGGMVQKSGDGIMLLVDTFNIGKKPKMNTQQILINNNLARINKKLESIDSKSPGVATTP